MDGLRKKVDGTDDSDYPELTVTTTTWCGFSGKMHSSDPTRRLDSHLFFFFSTAVQKQISAVLSHGFITGH